MAIDWWTLGLEALNFLILAWLLQRFFYRPVLAAIDRRRAEALRMAEETAATKSDAEAGREVVTGEREGIAAERERMRDEARQAADKERDTILAQAAVVADTTRAEARTRLARERTDAEATLRQRASDVAVALASRLLAEASDGETTARFVTRACDAIAAMPGDERSTLLREVGSRPLRLVAAKPLDADDVAHFTAAIGDALGTAVSLETADDPALIAGIELHFPHAVLRHNWRDALLAARAGLDEDSPDVDARAHA